MLFTLAAVVFFAAIITLFSKEFAGMFKKIWNLKGAKLILPLALASWLVYYYHYWALLILYEYKQALLWIIQIVAWLFPFSFGTYIAYILVLTLVTMLPVFLLDLFFRKKKSMVYPYPNLTSAFIWLVSVWTLLL